MKQLVCSVMLTNDLSKAESTGVSRIRVVTHSSSHAIALSQIRVVTHSGCHAFGFVTNLEIVTHLGCNVI